MRAPFTKSSTNQAGLIFLLGMVAVPMVGFFGASLYAGLHYGFSATSFGMLVVSSAFIAIGLAKLTIDYVKKLRTTGPDKFPGFVTVMAAIVGLGMTIGVTMVAMLSSTGFTPVLIALVAMLATIGVTAVAKMGLEYYLNNRSRVVEAMAPAQAEKPRSPSSCQTLVAPEAERKFVPVAAREAGLDAPAAPAETSDQAPALTS